MRSTLSLTLNASEWIDLTCPVKRTGSSHACSFRERKLSFVATRHRKPESVTRQCSEPWASEILRFAGYALPALSSKRTISDIARRAHTVFLVRRIFSRPRGGKR